ncbi:MAG: NTP transferase domain-containing protein [Treponema sp.]|jgi:GTP:adenosylcobinamide-phosphate guanylyltransferase/aminoglycoside phosphotransferase|nr:NTP transferase domain-containing protein [Treponema sp.]
MTPEYIVVQAGGKGTRLGKHTRNKPKCLVPHNNLPVIFHLFRRFPEGKFIIIGDYKHGVLSKYLEAFAEVKYLITRASGTGTCAGVKDALELIPPGVPFTLIWSDVILSPAVRMPESGDSNYLGVSKSFECRWSFFEGAFEEKPSKGNGVGGVFIFKNKAVLENVPGEGEFVRFLSTSGIPFKALSLAESEEVGTLDALNASSEFRCRSFNRLEISAAAVSKIPLNEQGKKLAEREIAWYREAEKRHFANIPKITAESPLTMKRIKGRNIFRAELDEGEKKKVIDNIAASLSALHGTGRTGVDYFSVKEAYYTKTIKRLEKVRALVPFANSRTIVVNGKPRRNIFFYREAFLSLVEKLLYKTTFSFIHGDCTFSNMMVTDDLSVIFLDPRGYFGFTEIYGDTAYDWAKVYYSLNGDYDQFNNGNFDLSFGDGSVELKIETSGWKDLSGYFLSRIPDHGAERIRFIHAIIWLSLTTYIWEDYDAICGAFYNGLLLIDDFLEGTEHD